MSEFILRCRGLTKKFGGLVAVDNVDLDVKTGSILGLIGPNGAGKTTLFNMISCTYPVTAGKITFDGKEIVGLQPYQVCRMGIGRTFQVVKIFKRLTVLDNVMTGAIFGSNKTIRNMKLAKQQAQDALRFVGLSEKEKSLAQDLPFAEMKKVELARALCTKPKLLLLDELVSGLNPTETNEATNIIKQIREKEITIVWVEHVMSAVMGTCDRIAVLNFGEKLAEGTPEEICRSEEVIEAYLGGPLV